MATVLFKDIVDSTKHAAEIGDQKWRDMLDRHNAMMHKNISHFRGRFIKITGDRILATFDGPARAIRCASDATEAARVIGIENREGLHTGEIELVAEEIGGITVQIASRVLGLASDNNIWVSRTVKDLVVGSGSEFTDQGVYNLKGIPGEWQLFSVEM